MKKKDLKEAYLRPFKDGQGWNERRVRIYLELEKGRTLSDLANNDGYPLSLVGFMKRARELGLVLPDKYRGGWVEDRLVSSIEVTMSVWTYIVLIEGTRYRVVCTKDGKGRIASYDDIENPFQIGGTRSFNATNAPIRIWRLYPTKSGYSSGIVWSQKPIDPDTETWNKVCEQLKSSIFYLHHGPASWSTRHKSCPFKPTCDESKCGVWDKDHCGLIRGDGIRGDGHKVILIE